MIPIKRGTDWLIDWAQQFLGASFAPWQRGALDQWIAAQPPSSEASINTPEEESGRGDKQ